MLNQQYCGEIESLLVQFISAMDDSPIYRTRENSDEQEIIIPRWLVGTKSRVFFDIQNQAGNITLPVAVVEPSSITLRKESLFNKQLQQRVNFNNKEYRYKQPTPVDIKVTVNFYTKFFNDIWQMFSNFGAFANPYIFVSWKTTGDLLPFTEEIRCKVTWDGSFNIDYPKTLSEDKLWLIHGTAGFTIEGWLFEKPVRPSKVITSVVNELGPTGHNVQKLTDKDKVEYYIKDGWPSITNIIVDNLRLNKSLMELNGIPLEINKIVIVEGRSFFTGQCTGILIKPLNDESINETDKLTKVNIDTIKMGKISGFALTEDYLSFSENIIKFKMPELKNNIQYDIIVYNNAGYASMKDTLGIHFFQA